MISAVILVLFLIFMFTRIPVAISITLATMIGMLLGGYDLLSMPQIMAATAKSTVLLAIPFFMLAALLMNSFGITERIFAFATALVGWIRGGLAQVNVLGSMIFSGISGTALADAAGLGAVEIRAMREHGYPLPFSCAVTVASATLGPIIPPSIMMLIYAIIADVSPAAMFLAGLLPGLVIGAVLMISIYVRVRLGHVQCPPPVPFSARRLLGTSRDGLLSLLTPAIILWGMTSGTVTPTEAGIIAIAYGTLLGVFYRSIRFAEVRRALLETVSSSALIMYVTAVSSVMSWVLVAEGTAEDIAQWLRGMTDSRWLFLIVANLFLLLLGCVIETLPALLIAVPVLLPAVDTLGIDRVHFGLIVIFNLLIGIMTPPMGIGLYIMVAISGVKLSELIKASVPFMITLGVALIVITFVPSLSLWLPQVLMR